MGWVTIIRKGFPIHLRLTLNKNEGALAGDVVDNGLQSTEVGLVECTSESSGWRVHALQQEGHTESVEPLSYEVVDRALISMRLIDFKMLGRKEEYLGLGHV